MNIYIDVESESESKCDLSIDNVLENQSEPENDSQNSELLYKMLKSLDIDEGYPTSATINGWDADFRYCNKQNILILGEMDFSFSLSLFKSINGKKNKFLATTNYESVDDIPDIGTNVAEAKINIAALKAIGCHIAFGIDAVNLPETLEEHGYNSNVLFHRVIFAFPRAYCIYSRTVPLQEHQSFIGKIMDKL